ncbi:MAG: ribosomal protein L6e-domain-containing protein, partial [Olpidium bornovanus]
MARNPVLAKGIRKFTRSRMYRKRSAFDPEKRKAAAAKPAVEKPVEKAPRFYPAEDVSKPIKCRKTQRPTKLRASITPGTVLIILAGHHAGKRVVFLKQLKSGLLLVTGPYKVNGVAVRRVNQAFVIATSTKVDLGGFKVRNPVAESRLLHYALFHRFDPSISPFPGERRSREKKPVSPERKADQKELDKVVLAAIGKVPQLKSYLSLPFSLGNKQAPH